MKIALHGAAGRMGQRLVACGVADPEWEIAAAVDIASHPKMGTDAGLNAGLEAIGVPLTSEIPADAVPDAVIDFSQPEGAVNMLRVCSE